MKTSGSRALRVLVIGAGPMACAVHLPVLGGLRDAGAIDLRIICDLHTERATTAQLKFGFAEHTGDAAAAVGRSDIDAVYIFGSASLHYRYGLAALNHGKHLFVEKPIAPGYAQALALARAASARKLIAVGGHNRRFYRAVEAVRARAGTAGWRSIEAVFHKPEYGRPAPFGARTWLGANGIHGLDALIFMMGALPKRLTALANPSATMFSAIMRWPNDAQGVFLCNNDAGVRREEYVLHGLGETCRIGPDGVTIERDGTLSTLELPTLSDGFTAEHEAFVRAIRDDAEPVHSIAALASSLFLADLIEAGFSGEVILPAAVTPQTAHSRAARASPANPAASTILVDQASELFGPLERHLPHHRLVTLDDMRRSPQLGAAVEAAVLGRGAAPLSPDVLNQMPHLGIVGVVGLSLTRHAPEALMARQVTVVNASRAYAESVAEFALALAILGRRRAFVSHEVLRGGGWGVTSPVPGLFGAMMRTARAARPAVKALGLEFLLLRAWRAATAGAVRSPEFGSMLTATRDLHGATVGLIGWGANARAFTNRLVRSHAIVRVYSSRATTEEIESAGAVPVSLREALAADVVSLHRGLTAATRHCLGAPELSMIRPGAVLINVARGALIEPAALLARLKMGDIFACLDTYEDEPLPRAHPLRSLSNVFLTSHIAGGSRDMHAAAADEVVAKIAAQLHGDVIEIVTADRLETMT
jgi:phosphoglycerate dehydrogenase-like enzyme/predicted dehydrogenase